MKEAVWACNRKAGLAEGEVIMPEGKVRRLPVVDESERLIDLPSLADLMQYSDSGSKNPPPNHQVCDTSTATCAPGAPRSRPPPADETPSLRLTPTTLEGALRQGGGGRLLDPAGREHRPSPRTVALRWCSSCGRFLGVKLWPLTSRAFVHTHGLCPACFERMTSDALMEPLLFGADQVGGAGDEPPR